MSAGRRLVRAAAAVRRSVAGAATWLLTALILGYQRYVSPAFGATCRYYPSCSAYALGAVRTHGPVKGFVLAVWRLVRCNPWTPGGIDHVPDRGSWRGGKDVRATQERVGS